VITGAGQGLGKALAQRLARRGLAVCVADINQQTASAVASELGQGAWAREVDVRNRQSTEELAAEASGRGRLAVWINNAGVCYTGASWQQPRENIDDMVAVNLLGTIHGSLAAVDNMDRSGRILNVASMSALGPTPGLSVYGATKHGILAFSTSLQAELRNVQRGVEVRTICPDAMDSQMIRDQAHDPHSALVFSARRLLSIDSVADRAIELLYGDRITATVPVSRGALARLSHIAPRLGFRAFSLLQRLGNANRRRYRKANLL
jgi:short-subunit dehydrogenase